MKLFHSSPTKASSPGSVSSGSSLSFSEIYDQYAALLLGVLTKIVSDKTEAVALLEVTFTKIRQELPGFQSGKQPLFVWLLQIARCTAQDALRERQRVAAHVFQLTDTGKVVHPTWGTSSTDIPAQPQSTDSQQKQLLNMILFNSCSPEEAAVSLNIPVETVRQQLRIAMQEVRK